MDLATAEGAIEMLVTVQAVTTRVGIAADTPEGRIADATEAVLARIAQGADDTYSGRGGDVQRAHFDGIRSVIRDVRFYLSA